MKFLLAVWDNISCMIIEIAKYIGGLCVLFLVMFMCLGNITAWGIVFGLIAITSIVVNV